MCCIICFSMVQLYVHGQKSFSVWSVEMFPIFLSLQVWYGCYIRGVCGCFAELSSSANASSTYLQFKTPVQSSTHCQIVAMVNAIVSLGSPKIVKVKLVKVCTNCCTYQPCFPSTQKSSLVCQALIACSGYLSTYSLESLTLPFCCR